MPLIGKENFPDLIASRSLHDTSFGKQRTPFYESELNACADRNLDRIEVNGIQERYPMLIDEAPPPPPASCERLPPDDKYKMYSYRFTGDHPPSTGGSAENVDYLTNGLGACLKVSLVGRSPDKKFINGRSFHTNSQLSKSIVTLLSQVALLKQNGLTDIVGYLGGAFTNAEKYREMGFDQSVANHLVSITKPFIKEVKKALRNSGVVIRADEAGKNRPNNLTTSSNVGFRIIELPGGTKDSMYRKNILVAGQA